MISPTDYQPRDYWENRLKAHFNLRGVGHISFSESYNGWLYRRKREVIESVFRGIDLRGKKVLDVGCGTGFFVDWYSHRGAQLWGIDITDVSVRELSKRSSGCFRTQDIADAAYQPSASFDVVNMWDVIYHIVDDQALDRALGNVRRSLKDQGLFLFTDRLGAADDSRTAAHVKERSLKTYQHLLSVKGFAPVDAKPLYRMLDKPHLRTGLDNHLGWLYYVLDKYQTSLAPDNLSLGIWKRQD